MLRCIPIAPLRKVFSVPKPVKLQILRKPRTSTENSAMRIEIGDTDAVGVATGRATLMTFPDEVLKVVDAQLRDYGLRIVVLGRDGEELCWTIERRGGREV
jgi:hypothetical protein